MYATRWTLALTLIALAIGGCRGAPARQPPRGQPVAPSAFVSFESFMKETREATPEAFASRAAYSVKSDAEFSKMRQHILALYKGVIVTNSFVLDNAHVDCIDIRTQPSLNQAGGRHEIARPPPAIVVEEKEDPDAPKSTPVPPMLDRRKKDRFGNVMYCDQGFIPMRRVTLDEMTGYPTLADYLSKSGRAGKSGDPRKG